MDELKKNVIDLFKQYNDDWVEAFRKGEVEGGLDLSIMLSALGSKFALLDQHFREAELRNKKRKGWFG